MTDKLGIVVPYRDRKDHLSQFVPHICDFFTGDKHNSIDVRVVIVEQPPGLPFNRGLICNIGYRIVCGHVGFVCFHDVDYLPVSANYSWPALPTMIIRHGFEFQAVHGRYVKLNMKELFSAVVMLQNRHFEWANGYPNDYWDWGYEDLDLKQRLAAVGLSTEYRDGTFLPLLHVHQGSNPDGTPTQAKQRNSGQFVRRWSPPSTLWEQEGLNSTDFSITHREVITPRSASRSIFVERALVQFSHRPLQQDSTMKEMPGVLVGGVDPRRNALCPCGSGKRFKRCHGQYLRA